MEENNKLTYIVPEAEIIMLSAGPNDTSNTYTTEQYETPLG